MTSSVIDPLAGARATLLERVRKERASLTDLARIEPVRVEDWTLYASGGAHLVRDLDLAERAELKNAPDIRTHIKKAARDGLFHVIADGDGISGPWVREVSELVPMPHGGARTTSVYYLNEEAALLLVTRLRTPKAIALTKAIVRVFLAVTKGEVGGVAAPAPANPPACAVDLGRLAEAIEALQGKLATIEDQQNKLLEAMGQVLEANRYVTPDQAAYIHKEALSLMAKWVGLGWAPNRRSAAQAIRPYVYSQVIWDGTQQIAKYLPKGYYESVRRALSRQHWIADQSLKRLGVLPALAAT